MPTIDDYASAADEVKARLPDDLRPYADDIDPQEIAGYAKDAQSVLSNPEKAILDFCKQYLVRFVGDAAAAAIGVVVGASIGTCIPVPVVGTLVGAGLGALCDAVLADLSHKNVDSNLDAEGRHIPELDALIREWAGPVPNTSGWFDDYQHDALVCFHTPGPGYVAHWMQNVDRWCRTEKRSPAPGIPENIKEMQTRFVNEWLDVMSLHYTHQTRRAQAHGQVTVGTIQTVNSPAWLLQHSGFKLNKDLLNAIAPPAPVWTAAGAVATLTSAQKLALLQPSLPALTAILPPTTLADYVKFYTAGGPSPRPDTAANVAKVVADARVAALSPATKSALATRPFPPRSSA